MHGYVKNRYDKAKAKKEERFKSLNRNFVPGSPMFVAERDRITPEFEAEVEGARDELSGTFEDVYMRTVAREKAAVTAVTGSTKEMLTALQYLEGMPVSLDEYNALTGCFGGRLYWLDRFFERIADKNGIAKTGVQPSLTAKLAVLEELAENTKQFLNGYDGERKNFIVTSSEKYIFSPEYAGVIYDNFDNRHFRKKMEERIAATNDSDLKECYENVRDMKQNEADGANKGE